MRAPDNAAARTLISRRAGSGRMLGRLTVPLVLILVAAGCVTPAADLDPASLAASLDGLTLEGATETILPNGDKLLSLVGEVAGVQEFPFEVPPGLRYVEVAVKDGPVSVGVVDESSGVGLCRGVRYSAWYVPIDEPFRCGAVAAGAAGSTWVVRVAGGGAGGVVPSVGPAAAAVEAVPFAVDVTFSAQPLDGTASAIKVENLAQPIYEALDTVSYKVPASADGAQLHVEVTLPDGPGPWPTLLVSSPYNSPDRAADGVANLPYIKYFTARGYAFATMDLRGTGISGGCFAMRGAVDQSDIKDVVDWLGTQEWSDGKVGMFGVSYEGFTPVAAAVAQPEHLTAIFAGAPAVDMYANYLPGGVNTGRTFSTGMVGYVVGSAADTTDDPSNPIAPVEYRADAVCDPLAITAGNDPRDVYSDYFVERNLTELADRIQVPIYIEQGFWDNNVKANPIPDLLPKLTVPKKVILGSWEHAFAVRADQWLLFNAWFDHWLQGRDTGIMDTPAVDVLTNTRQHRAADTWPSPDATLVEIPTASGQYVAKPAMLPLGAAPTSIETVREPFAEGLYVSGVPSYHFPASLARGGSTYFYAELYEEKADGEREIVIMGWLNAAHVDGHRSYQPLAPGEERAFEMQLLPIDHVVQPGSKLVLVLRSATTDDGYGGPEGGLSEPGVVSVGEGTLRLPTLPMSTLAPPPRSTG